MLGDDHPAVADTLGKLAAARRRRGNYSLAIALERRALETRRRSLGPEHPDQERELAEAARELGIDRGPPAALGVAVCEVLAVDEAPAVLVAGELLYADG